MSLHQAVKNGDKLGITYALSKGWVYSGEDINGEIFDSTPPTALGWALENKQYDTAKFLIKSGATLPSIEHLKLYSDAFLAGDVELIGIFLEKFGYKEFTKALGTDLFSWAKYYEDEGLGKLLDEKYADHKPVPPPCIITTSTSQDADDNPHSYLVEQLMDLGPF